MVHPQATPQATQESKAAFLTTLKRKYATQGVAGYTAQDIADRRKANHERLAKAGTPHPLAMSPQ